MDIRKNKVIILSIVGGIALIVVLVLYGLLSGGSSEDPRESLEAELDFWGVFDEAVAYDGIISSFNSVYPGVEINYRRFDSIDSYERTLLNSLAAGEGPDIFMIRNNDLKRKKDKISPAPSDKYSLLRLNQQFPSIVEENFVEDENIHALPLSVDTLSLIYNQDLLSENQIVFPPETWNEFINTASEVAEFDEQGNITTYGAAIGGSNIENAKDILSLIMIQSGSPMTNDSYDSIHFQSDTRFNPLEFYTSFARESSSAYIWDNNNPNSGLTEFKSENVGMVFGYHSDFSEIRTQAPFVETEVAPVPKFDDQSGSISYANYWGYAVSRQTQYPDVAWDFIVNMTTNASNVRNYLNVTNRPPALSQLVDEYLRDPEMNVFASQILTAESWPEPNPERVSEAFYNAIDEVINGVESPSRALNSARFEITNMMNEL